VATIDWDRLAGIVIDARDVAASIRQDWDRYQNVCERERKAATILLSLADELVKALPPLIDITQDGGDPQ